MKIHKILNNNVVVVMDAACAGALGSLPFAQEIHMLETVNHLCFEEETQRLWDRRTAAVR